MSQTESEKRRMKISVTRRLFIEPLERARVTDAILTLIRTAVLTFLFAFPPRQKQAKLVSASFDGSYMTPKLPRDHWRTCLQVRKFDQEPSLVCSPNTRFCGLHGHCSLRRIEP